MFLSHISASPSLSLPPPLVLWDRGKKGQEETGESVPAPSAAGSKSVQDRVLMLQRLMGAQ